MLREKLKFRRAFYPLKFRKRKKRPLARAMREGADGLFYAASAIDEKHIVAATGTAGNAVFC